jgi:hypothetical protein
MRRHGSGADRQQVILLSAVTGLRYDALNTLPRSILMLGILKRASRSRPSRSGHPSPLDRLISLWLSHACSEGASAIVIGMPRDLPSSVGTDYADAFREELTHDDCPIVSTEETEAHRALAMSSRLKSAAAWSTVPVWVRTDGRLYAVQGVPIEFHFALLSKMQDRLLSLDPSEENPRPMRFIEYDSDIASERAFAEVELWLDEDNTTRVEILRHLRLPSSVRAVPTVQ